MEKAAQVQPIANDMQAVMNADTLSTDQVMRLLNQLRKLSGQEPLPQPATEPTEEEVTDTTAVDTAAGATGQ
jgi:hypothetical protein